MKVKSSSNEASTSALYVYFFLAIFCAGWQIEFKSAYDQGINYLGNQ